MLEAVRESNVPVVGHNAFFDLAYTLESLVAPLPPSWEAFKALTNDWLPSGFWDTKYLARRVQDLDSEAIAETGLGQLYRCLEARALGAGPGAELPALASVDHALGYTRYNVRGCGRCIDS